MVTLSKIGRPTEYIGDQDILDRRHIPSRHLTAIFVARQSIGVVEVLGMEKSYRSTVEFSTIDSRSCKGERCDGLARFHERIVR